MAELLLDSKATRSDAETSSSAHDAEHLAYMCCLATVFVDLMGQNFASPVLVPYAVSLTKHEQLRGAVLSVAPLGRIVGGIIMPFLADATSRKKIVWLSMFGSAVAYALSSSAAAFGFTFLLLGRAVGGLFGETKPMLTAYLMELTMPDMATFKKRQTTLMTMNWGAGLVLTPIGGMLAAFGLNVPFMIATAGSLSGLVFSLLFMKDVNEIKPSHASDQPRKASAVGGGAASIASAAASAAGPSSSPWRDGTLLLLAAAYGVFGMAMGLQALMLPTLLEAPSFGLATERAIATTLGLTAFPGGVATVLTMQVGYMRISAAGVSDTMLVAIGGCIIGGSNLAYVFASSPAHLYLLSACNGLGQGLFMASFINLPNVYIAKVWSHALAQAKGVPFPFFNAGQIIGPFLLPMMHALLNGAGASAAIGGADLLHAPFYWVVLASLYLVSTLVLLVMAARIQAALGDLRARELRESMRLSSFGVLAALRIGGDMFDTDTEVDTDGSGKATRPALLTPTVNPLLEVDLTASFIKKKRRSQGEARA